jgi:hypothetical protein
VGLLCAGAGCAFRVAPLRTPADAALAGATDLAGGDDSADAAVPDLASLPTGAPDLARTSDGGDDPCGGPHVPGAHQLLARCVIGAAPTIDGDLGDWRDNEFTIRLDRASADTALGPFTGKPSSDDADTSMRVALRWDAAFLYLAAYVRDDVRGPSAEGGNQPLWNYDAVEVYVDGQRDAAGPYDADDLQLILTEDGVAGAYKNGSAAPLPGGFLGVTGAWAAPVDAADFTVEMRIPWSALGWTAGASGGVLGFDLLLDDDDATGGMPPTQTHALVLHEPAGACNSGCSPPACTPACNTAAFLPLVLGGR